MASYIWEIFVCFIESLLLVFLLYKKISFLPDRKGRLGISVIIMASGLSALTFSSVSIVVRMSVLLALCILVTFWTFDCLKRDRWYKAILWPSCFFVIVATADSVTFSIAEVMVDYPLEKLMAFSSARIPFTLIYLLLIAAMVWGLAHLGEPDPVFSLPVILLLFVLMGMGIFSSESILDLALVLGTSHETAQEAKTLIGLSYIILIMLFALLATFEWLGVIFKQNRQLRQQRQLAVMEQQRYELMVSTSESLAKWKHDYQGQLRLIAALIEQEKYAELKQFSKKLASALPAGADMPLSGNRIMDAVISLRMMDAKRHNIRFDTKLFLPERIPLEDVAAASLVGNLLDNAMEACGKVPTGTAEICFEIKPWKQMLYLFCSNTSAGNYHIGKNGHLLSTKKEEGHGIGLRRICEIVEQAGGTCQFSPEKNRFCAKIMIPLGENRE